MIYLSGAVKESYHRAGLGFMVNPQMGNRLPEGATFALDNGAFGAWRRGVAFDVDGWLRWLDAQPREGCLFAVAPDIVGVENCYESFEYSYPYLQRIRDLGFRAALVAQNAFDLIVEDESTAVLWTEAGDWYDIFDVLFIGGTKVCHPDNPGPYHERCDWGAWPPTATACGQCGGRVVEWKETEGAAEMIRLAHRQGKSVHVGRVNSARRAQRCAALGVESIDGTYLAFTGQRGLGSVLSWTSPLLPLEAVS